ncbi:TIR domain-containing protein [Pseudactinotalea sp. Z1748]|uniref:TIR domain-containing protein n=1 Tax=Pseudactinotalea sp. Z1748 TaxID=3413027 RepID=UPI003C7984E6
MSTWPACALHAPAQADGSCQGPPQRGRQSVPGSDLAEALPSSTSVKEPYATEWKEKVRTRIRRSHGVLVLVSKNSLDSSGQKWEIQCAKEEGKSIRGIWAYSDDRSRLAGVPTYTWGDANIAGFIDSL